MTLAPIVVKAGHPQLTKKHLDVTFQLDGGLTFDGKIDTLTVSGLRVQATVQKAGGAGLNTMSLRVYGMTQESMNTLAITGGQFGSQRNTSVTVMAYADGQTPAIVFQGTVNQCWPDYSGAPSVALAVTAQAALYDALKPAPPNSYPTGLDVATFMQNVATLTGYKLSNNGVTAQLPPSYFAGSIRDQAGKCAKHANINLIFDDGVLAIWPAGGVRASPGPQADWPVVSRETGMIGYPAWAPIGIMVRTIYRPTLYFGCPVIVLSDIVPASGDWSVYNMTHQLESETPGGAWETVFQASEFGTPLPASN